MAEAGRDVADLEMIGGIRGAFADETSAADLGAAAEAIPAQLAAGYTSICFKPSMFTDDTGEVGAALPRARGPRRPRSETDGEPMSADKVNVAILLSPDDDWHVGRHRVRRRELGERALPRRADGGVVVRLEDAVPIDDAIASLEEARRRLLIRLTDEDLGTA